MTADRRVWLRRIKIANFRGYGGDFDVALPPRGSVVLLSGANGLGKTSFFEAIEWGLTGGIARLERLAEPDKLELTRRHPSVNDCAVRLHFTQSSGDHQQESIIHRACVNSATRSVVSGSTPEVVVELLRNADDKWAVTGSNLVRYLYLTHFHPQSAPLRLIARSADDRWSWVSQLAGTERLELVRQQVRASKNNLTKIANLRETEVELARRNRGEWTDWVAQYGRLRNQIATLAGALTPADVVARLARLAVQLPPPIPAALVPESAEDDAVQEALAAATSLVQEKHALALQHVARLSQFRDAARRWTAAKAEAQTSGSLAVAARTQVAGLQPDLDRLEGELALARDSLVDAESRALQTNRLLSVVSDVLEARRERVAATAALGELEADIARLQTDVAEIQRDLASAEGDVANMRALETRQRQVEREQKALAQATTEFGALAVLRVDLSNCVAKQAALQLESAAIQAQEREAIAALEVASSTLRSSIKNVEGIGAAADAVNRSLVTIAAHIHEDDDVCPVCKTEFPKGVLKTLADSSSSLLTPALAAAQAHAVQTERTVRGLEDQVARLERARRSSAAEAASAADLSLDLSRKIDAVLSLPALAGGMETEIPQMLERRAASFAAEAAALKAQLSAYPLDEELAAKVGSLKQALGSASRVWETACAQEVAVRRRVAELLGTEGLLDEQRLEPSTTDDVLNTLKESSTAKLREANANAAQKRQLVEEALRQVNDARERKNALVAQEARARDEESERLERATQIAASWPAFLGPEPTEAAVDRGESEQHREIEKLVAMASELQVMTSGFHAWVQDSEVRDLERRLQQKASGKDWGLHAASLDDTIVAAMSALESARKVRAAADSLGDTLRERTSEFNKRVLEPIQGLFGRYLRALIHDDRFHDVGFEPHTGSSSGSLHFQLRVPDWEDMQTAEAEKILSEGQLAELSLAALFATSSAYRWSDWRALLLDDPTQYNDLVHSTSLLEVVRNLAYFQDYQVFLSTHDLQQAAFFRRKLEGMGVPWTECRFTSQGDGGIEYVVTSAKNDRDL